MNTPWGKSQEQVKLATGFIFYSTAGHGGLHVSKKKNLSVPDYIRQNDGWYEEDCEIAKIMMLYPAIFTKWLSRSEDEILYDAYKIVKNYFPSVYEKYTGNIIPPGESYVKDRETFIKENKNNMVVVSATIDPEDENYVLCLAVRGGRDINYNYASNDRKEYRFTKKEYRHLKSSKSVDIVIDENKYKPVK